MARRFIVEKEDFKIEENKIAIKGEEVKHINILRHNVGDNIIINEFVCKIEKIDKKNIECEIIKKAEEKGVPNIDITLFQALLKADKMDYVVQKAVEIGAKSIVPLETRNIVVKLDDKAKLKKCERYNKISKEASKQCGRTDIVNVENVVKFNDALKEKLSSFDAVFLAYEAEEKSLKNAINIVKKENKDKKIAIIIGPEGGFDKEEIDNFSKLKNLYTVSLGTRILRAETASLNLLSILIYEFEL